MYFLVRLTFWSFYLNSVNYFAIIIAIADLFQVGYVEFLPPMASHPQAGVHFRNAVEHLHLTDMRFILHPLLISCMSLGLQASASKQLIVVHLYHLASHLFHLVHFLYLSLHGLLELERFTGPLITINMEQIASGAGCKTL